RQSGRSKRTPSLLELRAALPTKIDPAQRGDYYSEHCRKRDSERGPGKRAASPVPLRSAIRAKNLVHGTKMVCEQFVERAFLAARCDRQGLLLLIVGNLHFDPIQRCRVMPCISDVKFVNYKSRNAFSLQAAAEHVRFPRLAECRYGRRHMLIPA